MGANAFLIGESLMRADNIAEKLSELKGEKHKEKAGKPR